jgi:large subunit ribosomal protein L9
MEILFVQDVPGVGKAGQTKKVADGYARNYLLKNNLAVVASAGAVKHAESLKLASAKREADTLQQAQTLANAMNQVQLKFTVKAGTNDRLFGAITAADIAEKLDKEQKIKIDRRKLELDHPIKDLGERAVPVKLHPEVTAQLHVLVEREQS